MPLLAAGLGGSGAAASGGLGVTAAVLVAALLHAAWNAVAHRITDPAVASSLIGSACAVAGLGLVLCVRVPSGAAWPYLLGSAAMHVVYLLLLLRSYRLGDFNRMYPLARGTSPLVVAVLAVTVVGQPLSLAHAGGVVVISAGLAVLVLAGGVIKASDRAAVIAAVLTGLAIATYTVLDGVGVRHSGSTLGYIGWLFLLQGVVFPLIVLAQRGGSLVADARPFLALGLASGLVSVVAYGIVIWAQTRSNLASVAALRELSIVFAALIGMVFFHERFGLLRTLGAALAVAGVLLLNS